MTCQAVASIKDAPAAYPAGVKKRIKPMSASIETRPRRSRHETEPTPEPVATDATDESATAETVTAKAEGIAYTLPRTAKAGDVHTDNSALVYDLAKARQFVSMMASKARSRAKKFVTATTDAEREANKAFTLNDYLAAWPTFTAASCSATIASHTFQVAVSAMVSTAPSPVRTAISGT